MDKVKVLSNKVAKGFFLAVGIPYSIAIIINMMCGWPCSQEGDDKYKRALQPSRVLKVTYAVAEQCNLVRFLPLYIKWNSLYKAGDKVIKDIKYGVNGNTLDLWIQKFQEKPEGTHPVVVFVYGGAWGSGDKNMYGLLAQEIMDHLGAVVVIPNYSIHPKGEVQDMVRDLHDTIAFIKSPEFQSRAPSADQNKIILFGHSAGAHLSALAVIELAEGSPAEGSPAKGSPAEGSLAEGSPAERSPEESRADHSGDDTYVKDKGRTDDDSSLVYSSSSFSFPDLLSSVRGVVGVGGVYHIMDHYHHESWRGVEDLSPMWRVMNGLHNFDQFSPTERVLKMSNKQISRLPPVYVIHGTNDKIVPPSSTEKFSSALSEKEANVTVRMIADGGHAELIIDMMDSGRKFYDAMTNLTLEFAEKILK